VAESTSVFYEAELREINNILTRGPCYDRRAALICLCVLYGTADVKNNSTAVITEEQYSSHYIRTAQKTQHKKNSMVCYT
jgi:hypothetical protein